MRSALRKVAEQQQGPRVRRWLSVAETARELGLGEETLRRCIKAGEFPAVRIGTADRGGRYLVPVKALEQLADAALSEWGLVEAADFTAEFGSAAAAEGVSA